MISASESENPTFTGSEPLPDKRGQRWDKPAANAADIEAAVASLKEKMEPETVEDLEAVMRAREAALQEKFDAKLAQLEAKIEHEPPLISAVRSVYAQLSEARPNWHQATVMLVAASGATDGEDADAENVAESDGTRWRVGSLAVSALMVLGQCMVAVGVATGTISSSCASNDQCEQGRYCSVGGRGRCHYCGSDVPLPQQTDPVAGGTLNWAEAENYAGFNATLVAETCADLADRRGTQGDGLVWTFPREAVQSWCERCVFNDGRVDELTNIQFAQANIAAMGPFDWVALVLCFFVVALTIGGELKDIKLCGMAIRQASDRIAPAWRSALFLLGGMRRWVFLPTLIVVVPWLVLLKGGDALSVCFNTVAVLFLCELDNLAYAVVLPERLHTRVENEGRVELGELEAAALMVSKGVHVATLVAMALCAVAMGDPVLALWFALPAFWVAGAVEAVVGSADTAQTCASVAKVTGRWLSGAIGIWLFFVASFFPMLLLPIVVLLAVVTLIGARYERLQ